MIASALTAGAGPGPGGSLWAAHPQGKEVIDPMEKEPEKDRDREVRLPYHPPELREYGSVVKLTGGPN